MQVILNFDALTLGGKQVLLPKDEATRAFCAGLVVAQDGAAIKERVKQRRIAPAAAQTATLEGASAPAKRKPGRPRKSPLVALAESVRAGLPNGGPSA